MNIFDDEEKIYVSFEIRGHGKTHSFNSEYEDCVNWSEILDDVVRVMESSWGYTFDLDVENPCSGKIGVYYKGKSDD